MNESLLEIRDLKVHYPARRRLFASKSAPTSVRAVDGITFDIHRGEVLAVVGESGCGKTTLGKALTRLLDATAGSISYRGKNLLQVQGDELRSLRQKIQTIFQDPYESLDPRQSIFDIVAEPLRIHQCAASDLDLKQRVHSALESAGLFPTDEIARRYPHLLSGGQRQRVSIAAAMALEPEFIVADEPVSMLDVSIRAEIIRLMLNLRERNQLTYLFITHDLSLAWMIADRIMVLYLGKMMELGSAQDIINSPQHPYTQALVSVIPIPEPSERSGRIILTGETPSPLDIPPGCRFHPRCWKCRQLGSPETCLTKEPELASDDGGHLTACHFADR
ncbi:MAG: ABC transporter ATP-binding protein [Chloroflexota bacterium]